MTRLGAAIFLVAAVFSAQCPAPSGPPASAYVLPAAGDPVRAAPAAARRVSEAVPTAALTTPRPSALSAESAGGGTAARTIRELVAAAALEFGVDPVRLEAVAFCESTLDPLAVGRAQEVGLFQWLPRTWQWLAAKSGLGYSIRDVADPRAQSRLTAWAFANGYAHLWTCARKVA